MTRQTDHGTVRLVQVPADSVAPSSGALLAVRSASAVESGAANAWTSRGEGPQGHMAIDPGLVVTVGGDGKQWLLYGLEDDRDPGEPGVLLAGIVDKALLEHRREAVDGEPLTVDLTAVLSAGTDAELVLGSDARLLSTTTHAGPVDGLEAWTATVEVPAEGLQEQVEGLDLTGDGDPDLHLAARG